MDDADKVIDLDDGKFSADAALWWKACVFVQAHMRRSALEVEKNKYQQK
jgi:hypothetical protein